MGSPIDPASDAERARLEQDVIDKAKNLVTVFRARMQRDPSLAEWLKSDTPSAHYMRGLIARVKALEAAETA